MKFSVITIILGLGAVSASTVAISTDPGPSPTASVGCEPHGNHWHCDGPITAATVSSTASSATAASATASSHDDDHSDHDHDDDNYSLSPSPTDSIGCKSHGDHWHCDGPKPTGAANVTSGNSSTSASPSDAPQTGSGGKNMVLSFGSVVVAVGGLVFIS